LHGNQCGFIQSPDDHRWKEAVNFVIDNVKWQIALGPGAGLIRALMGKTPVAAIERHRDRLFMAEGTFQQHPVSPWHVVVVGVGVARLRVLRDRIGSRALADKKADREWISRNRLLPTHALSPCHCICESLCLLERKHP
jgi:hypothetical protein